MSRCDLWYGNSGLLTARERWLLQKTGRWLGDFLFFFFFF